MTDELDIMARTVFGEARNQRTKGRAAVAHVILNRRSPLKWWNSGVVGCEDGSIQAVCLKPYQFSAWNADDPNREKLLAVTEDDPVFADCKQICEAVIKGEIPDPTGGATSYYSDTMPEPPRWANHMYTLCKIGRHVFLREFI